MTCLNSGIHNKLTEFRTVLNGARHISAVNIEIFQIGESINAKHGSFNTAVNILIVVVLCPLLAASESCLLTVGNHSTNLSVFKINTCHIKHTQSGNCGICTCKVIVSTRGNSFKINKKIKCYHCKSGEEMEIIAVIKHKIAKGTHINKVCNNSNNCDNEGNYTSGNGASHTGTHKHYLFAVINVTPLIG